MNRTLRTHLRSAVLGALLITPTAMAQTAGTVTLTATIKDLSASGTEHYAVVWVTGPSPTNPFIKTVWKQGDGSFSGNWTEHTPSHFKSWNDARGSSQVLDGYTTTTAADYTAVIPPASGNNPIYVKWNCKNAANNAVVADGTYNFFIQYAEDISNVNGPVTTALTWTKGPNGNTWNPAAQGNQNISSGNNFTGMSIVWTPTDVSVAVAPGSVAEDGVPNLVYTFTRTGATTAALTANFTVGGSATFNTDYTQSGAASFTASTGTVTIPIGSSTATVTVNPTADTAVEPDETVTLTVVGSNGVYNMSPSAPAATGSITNDDTAFSSWASVLPAGQNGPGQTPKNDGVTNLMKFACNLDPTKPDVRTLTAGGNGLAGLPGKAIVGGKLRMEFLRRKASTNPGITYMLQFAADLVPISWNGVDVTTTPAGTSIDGTWERVVVDDTVAGSKRFGRLKVVQSP